MTVRSTKSGEKTGKPGGFSQSVLPKLLWGVAILMMVWMIYTAVNRAPVVLSQAPEGKFPQSMAATATPLIPSAALPTLAPLKSEAVSRSGELHTDIPVRANVEGKPYTVDTGDSVFALADYFKIKPETILWANYEVLNDNPDMLAIGQKLYIPATDGVVHKWREGDTLQSVANLYKAKAEDILLWPGNKLDIVDPQIQPGTLIMVPGGQREFRRSWIIPTIPRGAAGVALSFPGGCDTGSGGYIGTGTFSWPSPAHTISGNDYWSGHLAIDIAIGIGTPVTASDSGVVVFSGWSPYGYGNMVMIDHGNGFQTLYAHMTATFVTCGQSVAKGQTIGTGGTTGNSTGPHLHFEIRYMGGFVNPRIYLR